MFNSPQKGFLRRFEAPGAKKTPNCRNIMIKIRLFVWGGFSKSPSKPKFSRRKRNIF
jgi:hypothetical protein